MPKTRWALHTIFSLVGALALSAGCGGSKKTKNISVPPQRDGNSFSAVVPKYNDNAPSLSADGTKVVFLSGRESTDTALLQKAFKADWPVGAAPGAPARLTTEDLGVEKAVAISRDGAWTAIVATKEGVSALHLQDYASAKAAVTIVDDGALKVSPTFSPDDSKLLAWISRDANDFGTVKLVTIGTGTAADVATVTAITDTENNAETLFWVPTGDATYALAIGARKANKGTLNYTVRRFSTAPEAATVEATAFANDILPAKEAQPTAALGKAFVPQRVPAYEGRQVDQVGDIEVTDEAPAPKFGLDSEALSIDIATKTASSLVAQPGSQIVALSAGDATAFASMRFYYGCKNGNAGRGSGLVIAPLDGATPVVLVPMLTATEAVENEADKLTFEVGTGFCDNFKVADDPASGFYRQDSGFTEIAASASSTVAKFRVAYVSTFTDRFESDCRLRTGDQEVRVIDGDGETKKVYDLSAYRFNIENVAGASCSL